MLGDACPSPQHNNCGLQCTGGSNLWSFFKLCQPWGIGTAMYVLVIAVILLFCASFASSCCVRSKYAGTSSCCMPADAHPGGYSLRIEHAGDAVSPAPNKANKSMKNTPLLFSSRFVPVGRPRCLAPPPHTPQMGACNAIAIVVWIVLLAAAWVSSRVPR